MTVTVTGADASHPFVCLPGHLCDAISRWKTAASPRFPSIATSLSPDFSTLAAGYPFSITPTFVVAVSGPIRKKKTNSSRKASTRLTAGPAAITTMRFQTGCE